MDMFIDLGVKLVISFSGYGSSLLLQGAKPSVSLHRLTSCLP